MDIMRRIGLYTALTLALGLSAGAAIGDTLLVDSVESGSSVARPDRGMTMDGVLQRYGEPALRSGPVGDPPISTWDYGDFVVYFENQYVIHSVVAHKK
jgi:hypothetical protein